MSSAGSEATAPKSSLPRKTCSVAALKTLKPYSSTLPSVFFTFSLLPTGVVRVNSLRRSYTSLQSNPSNIRQKSDWLKRIWETDD